MCPNCGIKTEVTQDDNTGRFHCSACLHEFVVKSECKIVSIPDSLKEELSYKCEKCGSRTITECYSSKNDMFVLRWNLELANPPNGWEQSKGMLFLDASCDKCGKQIKEDQLWLFNDEINRKWDI